MAPAQLKSNDIATSDGASKEGHAMTRIANFYLYQLNSVEWV